MLTQDAPGVCVIFSISIYASNSNLVSIEALFRVSRVELYPKQHQGVLAEWEPSQFQRYDMRC